MSGDGCVAAGVAAAAELGPRARAAGFASLAVACEPTGHRWRVLDLCFAEQQSGSCPFTGLLGAHEGERQNRSGIVETLGGGSGLGSGQASAVGGDIDRAIVRTERQVPVAV